jgi:hypothetical protein
MLAVRRRSHTGDLASALEPAWETLGFHSLAESLCLPDLRASF